MIKEREDRAKNHYGFCDQPKVDEFLYALPYELTGAQKKVWTGDFAGYLPENLSCQAGTG